MSAEKFCDQEEWCGFVHAGTVHRLMDAYAASEVKRVAGPLVEALTKLRDGYGKMLASAQCMNLHHEISQRHSGWECPVVNELSETLTKADAALAAARAELEETNV